MCVSVCGRVRVGVCVDGRADAFTTLRCLPPGTAAYAKYKMVCVPLQFVS